MKFLLDKNFVKPSYLCITEKVCKKTFANAVKVAISILYAIFNTGQKIGMIKFSPIRTGVENFLLVKISIYTVY